MSSTVPSCHPLGEQISELAAQLNAATCALIELIGRFDTERGWAQDGCRSCAHWLNWKCGIGLVAAREKVRVAAALEALPTVHEGGFTVQPDVNGTFHFHRPDGQRMVHESPCNTVEGDPATILRKRQDQRGIHIDAGTAVPHWDGLPMDDGMAVEGLLQANGKLDDWA